MSDNIKNLNFDKALQAIELVSETFKINVFIPSLQKEYEFKEIDAKQQKSLLSSALNASVYNSSFVKAFYKIIEENLLCENKNEILEYLNVFDKIAIALSLKKQISPETKVSFDDKNEITQFVKIEPIIEKFKTFKNPNKETINFEQNGTFLRLEVGIPSIKKEYEYEQEIHKKDKKLDDIKSSDDVKNIVSDAFITETSKYINEIWVNGEAFAYDSFDFSKKISIVEKLPSVVIQKILEHVSIWKKSIDDVLTVELSEDISSDGKKYTKVLGIDSMLFLA